MFENVAIIGKKTFNWKHLKFQLPAFCIWIFCLLFFLSIVSLKPFFLERLDNMAYDLFMEWSRTPHVSKNVVVVGIDDKSLEVIGQWPWPRRTMASLARKCLDMGASAVGFDLIFSEPDRTSPAYIQEGMQKAFGFRPDFSAIPEEHMDHDRALMKIMNESPVISGILASFEGGDSTSDMPKGVGYAANAPDGIDYKVFIPEASGFVFPIPGLDRKFGIVNSPVGNDGIGRGIVMLVRNGNNVYPAFSLRLLMERAGVGTLAIKADEDGLSELKIGSLRIPVEGAGMFRPKLSGHDSYKTYRASDIIYGNEIPDLEGKIVLIGATSQGLTDIRNTSLERAVPGVYLHAELIDGMMSGSMIEKPNQTMAIQLFLVAGAVMFAGGLAVASPVWSFPLLIAVVFLVGFGSYLLFENGTFVSPVPFMLSAIFSGTALSFFRIFRERRIRNSFSHYVSPAVARKIARDGIDSLDAQRQKMTLMFTDIRGFTGISEKMQPDDLMSMLNEYFTPMTKCVFDNNGTIDKFIGDSLMAYWNPPFNRDDYHQSSAVRAALDMQAVLAVLRPRLAKKYGHYGKNAPVIRIGIGIHSGEVCIGHMKGKSFMDCTCVGKNVNLASRLEGLCKEYGVGIIVSRAVTDKCDNKISFLYLGKVTVKGSSEPLDIFMPVIKLDKDFESAWKKAITQYLTGDFQGAAKRFENIGAPRDDQEVKALLKVFIERCRAGRPDNWNGIWIHDTK